MARRVMYGVSSWFHGFTGSWPEFTGVQYGAAQSDAYCQKVREFLDLPGDTLYLPAVSSTESGNAAQVFKDPIGWCQSIVDQFSRTLAEQ
jgi:hypothetical protein